MSLFFRFSKQVSKKAKDAVQPHVTKVGSGLTPTNAAPDELLGELFQDVQLRRIHDDGKTFVDLVPKTRLSKVLKLYEAQRQDPHFDLHAFVDQHFKEYIFQAEEAYTSDPKKKIEEHIDRLWTVLTRRTFRNRGSLMALPYPYIVPGGRFSEMFYWDTYFIMLGLARSGHYEEVEGMIKNYAYLIRKVGYIPTASRTYLLSRSQPPFFAMMIHLLAESQGKTVYIRYLPYLLAEHRFWMKGYKDLSSEKSATQRVVRMPNGITLNRYYDKKSTPRPESYKEDVEAAHEAKNRIASQVYRDLRAGAESGWDFSSRWFKDDKDISTIHTTDMVPVDLNCLLVELERTIAYTYDLLKQPILAKRFRQRAEARSAAIREYCWSPTDKFFFDYDIKTKKPSPHWTLAGAYPLYLKVASDDEAAAAAREIKRRFLKEGGLTTTTVKTGQQWDAPNGWAPLQWVTIQGLRNYGHHELADEIQHRWVNTVTESYKKHGKIVEKYDVFEPRAFAGGGEYELQDGFGWTNGVLLALLADKGSNKSQKGS